MGPYEISTAFVYPRPSKNGQTCAPYTTKTAVNDKYMNISSSMVAGLGCMEGVAVFSLLCQTPDVDLCAALAQFQPDIGKRIHFSLQRDPLVTTINYHT